MSQFAPAVPERKSSLERKSDKKIVNEIAEGNEYQIESDNASENNDELKKTTVVALIHDSPSPDSGHNTSSSPAESASQNSHSPHEHLEFSESDLESCDRTERIRTKTAMTTCRIPSMCLITPPQSDDEVNLRNHNQVPFGLKYVPYESVVQREVVRNDQNVLNGKLFTQNSNGKPLHIQIPRVPDLKKEITDIYAYPDKSKKTKLNTVKTILTNGVLETCIDSVSEDSKDSLHLIVNGETGYATIKTELNKTHRSPSPSGGVTIVKEKEDALKPSQPVLKPSLLPTNFMERFKEVINKQKKLEKKNDDGDYVTIADSQKSPKTDLNKENRKSEYVSLNELPVSKSAGENPLATCNDSSLERKKRQGARVTLDSDGKVVYSSDSLKRKKQHSTFVPGKYVRESSTPSPLANKRTSKPIRPVNCSGLIRTNSDDQKLENGAASPQMGKLIIKAGSKFCDSPTKDFVRMPPSRVVTPTNLKKQNDKGVRITLENGELKNRSVSPSSSDASSLERRKRSDRCASPSSSSSSSSEPKKQQIVTNLNNEEGKILNENDLDDLGENLASDFFNRLDAIKLNVPLAESNDVPDIFRIEPEIPVPKKQIKRSDSYRMANHFLSLPVNLSANKLTTLTENVESESFKSKCKIPIDDPNYLLLMSPDATVRHSLKIDPQSLFGNRRSPYKVTKPTDTEIAKVLKNSIANDTEIW